MKQKGFTLLEILIAAFVLFLVVAGLLGGYLLIQRHWSGGGKQIRVQGQSRNAMNEICREIRGAQSVSGGGDEILIVRIPENERVLKGEPREIGFHYVDVASEDLIEETLYLFFGASWAGRTDERVIATQVIRKPGENIFTISGRRVTVRFRARDATSRDGYQGIDLQSSAYRRN